MTKQRLLKDVNLSEIRFGEEGSIVILTFLNMSDGAEVGTLVCNGVAFFAYSNDPDDSLPTYVGEVNRTSLPDSTAASDLLRRLGYGYRDFSGTRMVDGSAGLCHVQVEGGCTLDVVCRETRLAT